MSQVSNNMYGNFGNIIIKESKNNSLKLKRIGNYILSNTIGTGTFNKVKLGIHLQTNEKVVNALFLLCLFLSLMMDLL